MSETTETKEKVSQDSPKPVTLAAWKKAKRHQIALPSGVEVEIEVPNLPKLIAGGTVPNTLVQSAISFAQKPRITPELIQEQYDFTKFLVSQTVKVPELSEAEVEEIPYEDLEYILEFATRQRDMDAIGRHMAGLEKVESFRRFRGLPDSDEDLARL